MLDCDACTAPDGILIEVGVSASPLIQASGRRQRAHRTRTGGEPTSPRDCDFEPHCSSDSRPLDNRGPRFQIPKVNEVSAAAAYQAAEQEI